ncbi:hypothetical protein D9M68_962470 [compost metagenome]
MRQRVQGAGHAATDAVPASQRMEHAFGERAARDIRIEGAQQPETNSGRNRGRRQSRNVQGLQCNHCADCICSRICWYCAMPPLEYQ